MAPPCKKIKYTKGRSSRPVLKIQKPPTPSKCPNSSSTDSTISSIRSGNHRFNFYGEGEDYGGWVLPRKTPLEYLRRWVEKQRFIPQDLSDEFLSLYLSGVDYNVKEAAIKLEKYFQSRQSPSYLFRNRDPLSSENQEIFDTLYALPMPGTTENGQKIILTGLLKSVTSFCQLEHAKALAMTLDLLIWVRFPNGLPEKDFGFGDLVIVLDGRGFQCPQILGNQLPNHKSLTHILMDTIPGKLSSFYLLYPPPYVSKVASIRDEIWITVVCSKQEMISYLPADTLPLEFGGNLGHLEDILAQWKLHMAQCRNFFINFEKRMINDYNRKLCYEKEVKERGKNWVQKMKLEADEWEYKIQYYEKMKNFVPLKHPAFGSQRNLCKPKKEPVKDPLKKCRDKAREEDDIAKIFEPTLLYHGYAKEIRKAQLESEIEKPNCWLFPPVRELQIIFY